MANTPITKSRLGTDTLSQLDAIARANGLRTRSDAIRISVKRTYDQLPEAEKIIPKKEKEGG